MKHSKSWATRACAFLVAVVFGILNPAATTMAQDGKQDRVPPSKSSDQRQDKRNTIPRKFKTEVIAVDDAGRARAEQIVEVYEMLATKPTLENIRKYVSDDYIQHSTTIDDGPEPLSALFSWSVAKYPAAIDVHKVMVVGDWAMAHVNFRNLASNDPNDLGTAAVDIYLFDIDGKIREHWDVLQNVPSYSANPNGMFLRKFEGEFPYSTSRDVVREASNENFIPPRVVEIKRIAEAAKANSPITENLLTNASEPPASDRGMRYYNRQRIDICNLRDYYDGLLIADMMIHADGMFDAKTKWKLTLFQMVSVGSNHHQARAAKQLSLMGVPMGEISAIWSPGYVANIKDPRTKAAFEFVEAASSLPSSVTADTHASLRMHFIDRQIAELIELTGLNAANAMHDQLLPIPTDQNTIDWATKNFADVGWSLGHNKATNGEEQRSTMFVGDDLKAAYNEIVNQWQPEDLAAIDPEFQTDWINRITGYGISERTFDADKDGIEDPFDFFPNEYLRWEKPDLNKENLPQPSTPAFDVAAYDYKFYQPKRVQKTKYPFSDRQNFDTEWTRQKSIGSLKMDGYFSADRALTAEQKWQIFFVQQLAAGCPHCQVHGAYGIYYEIEDEYPDGKIPLNDRPAIVNRIRALIDFERSDLFTAAEKAAFRFARDGGRLPGRTTAAHIEELRRHYSDREIQEIMATLTTGAWLASCMQSQVTVTERESMAWALRNLTPAGWKPGSHTGLPQEQRRFHMAEIGLLGYVKLNSGKIPDIASEWVDMDVPLAIDSDSDGVDDTYDGFPNDPKRWEDTDRDGIEDKLDDDIDGDGIPNAKEVAQGTFPYKADSDGDGVDDPTEIKAGTSPVDPRDF